VVGLFSLYGQDLNAGKPLLPPLYRAPSC
jgi:hypothetical protein